MSLSAPPESTAPAPVPVGTVVANGVPARYVWAVGQNGNSGGVVERWDGSTWTATPIAGTQTLLGLWSFSASSAWAVGGDGSRPVAVEWDGTSWSTPTAVLTAGYARDIWGADNGELWTVGSSFAAHRTGANWSSMPLNFHAAGVWGRRSDDIWAVGEKFGSRWNGANWSLPVPVVSMIDPEVVYLDDLWGDGTGSLWAVGYHEPGGVTNPNGMAVSYDGNSWSPPFPLPGMGSTYAVWGSGPTDIWVAGAAGFENGGVVCHWNGRAWSNAVAVPGTLSLRGVWGSGSGDVWAVGSASTSTAVAVHWVGGWSSTPIVIPISNATILNAVRTVTP